MSYQQKCLIDLPRAKNIYLYLPSCCVLLFASLVLWSSQAYALTVQEEVAIDRQAGLLDRPWKINLIRISTRDYLKRRAVIKTGFRAHDRDAHKAEQAPEAHYAGITRKPTSDTTVTKQPTVEPGTQSTPNPTTTSSPAGPPVPNKAPVVQDSPPSSGKKPPVYDSPLPPTSPGKKDPGLDTWVSPPIVTHGF